MAAVQAAGPEPMMTMFSGRVSDMAAGAWDGDVNAEYVKPYVNQYVERTACNRSGKRENAECPMTVRHGADEYATGTFVAPGP